MSMEDIKCGQMVWFKYKGNFIAGKVLGADTDDYGGVYREVFIVEFSYKWRTKTEIKTRDELFSMKFLLFIDDIMGI